MRGGSPHPVTPVSLPGLSYPVFKGIMKKGYKVPTPIQRKVRGGQGRRDWKEGMRDVAFSQPLDGHPLSQLSHPPSLSF